MSGRRLLDVEGFPVGVRFDPDRFSQLTALTAVDRGVRELLLEVLDSLKSGFRVRGLALRHSGVAPGWNTVGGGDVALHGVSVPAHAHQVLFHRAQRLPAAALAATCPTPIRNGPPRNMRLHSAPPVSQPWLQPARRSPSTTKGQRRIGSRISKSTSPRAVRPLWLERLGGSLIFRTPLSPGRAVQSLEVSTSLPNRPQGTRNGDTAGRHLTWTLAERPESFRFLIRDRDQKFADGFNEVIRSDGIEIIRTPFRAPQANGVADRFVRTVRSECLDWLLILDQQHLERVLAVFVDHYNVH